MLQHPTPDYLALYDTQLRTDAEMAGAMEVTRLGPLWLACFPGGQGFISYAAPLGSAKQSVAELAEPALQHFQAKAHILSVEFKTRGHDETPGLHRRLLDLGFRAGEPESVMIGPLTALAQPDPWPGDLTVRRIRQASDITAMCTMVDQIFDQAFDAEAARELVTRVERDDPVELWVAELDGRMVGAGRLEPAAGTQVAGLWGGAVQKPYRGRGIYRALTSARARSALSSGYRWAHSDSTEYSRPILERQGLIRVTTTTPYEWTRA